MRAIFIFTFSLILLTLTGGCLSRPERTAEFKPFETVELDAVLAIVVDLSGSFHDDWQRDGRAHRLFLDLVNQFFEDRIGTESRVIIGQISNSDSFVLFDGTPQELTKKFRDPEQLNRFLVENADPDGSKVFQSTRRMLDYLAELDGVTEATQVLTVILSDMKDSESEPEARQEAGDEMLNSLKTYSKSGGGVALYFVAEDEKTHWRRMLEQAKFTPGTFVIQGQLTETPQLPRFE